MTELNFEKLNKININYLEKSKTSLLDPLGFEISRDVQWVKLNKKWNHSRSPVVCGRKGHPLLLLHGFDSSFLEFRRIYPSLKNNFQLIIPDLLGFGFSPRF